MVQIVNDIGTINVGALITYAGILGGFLTTIWLMVI